jgi:tetratricopeptide (TPR) repeat protein
MKHSWILGALLALASASVTNAQNAASQAARQVANPAATNAAERPAAQNPAAQNAAVQNTAAQAAATQAAATQSTAAQSAAAPDAAVKNTVAVGGTFKATASVSVARGVELTRRAQTTTDPAEKASALREAEQIYTDVVKADPKAGAALNNLAVLAVGKGNSAAARQYFESAMASDDGHEALYALNYSKFLQTSDKPAAVKAARLAVKAAPGSTTAKEHLGELLWQTNPAEMLPLATELVSQGHSELATRFALQCLTSQSRPESERRAWLVLLASRLSHEYAISEEVRRSLAQDLAKLESDPMIGRGSQQLRAVIDTPPKSTADVSWWASQSSVPSPGSATGRAAMRDVLLAAGQVYARQDMKRAEQYFMTAIELGERGPDPDAFLRLVELYASHDSSDPATGAKQQLAALMNRYQFEMFSEKSRAYAEGNWPLIYRMHVALGMTYAYLKTWTSAASYQNAIFQLSNAMKAAERANQDPRWRGTPLALPPVGVQKLAEGYLTTGRKDLALQARIDGAAALNRIGHARASTDVFRSIPAGDVATLDQGSRVKYEDLRSKLPGA